MIIKLFHWVLLPEAKYENPEGLFPAAASFSIHTPDFILDRIITPFTSRIAAAATLTRRLVQQGLIGVYLLYIALTLCLLLAAAIYLR